LFAQSHSLSDSSGSPLEELPTYYISRLYLTAFRSYTSAEIECDQRPVILTGANGAGKTNILEALSFLNPGKGLRSSALSEITCHTLGQDARWSIASELSVDGVLQHKIGTGLQFTQTREKRDVRIDGENSKSHTHLSEYLNILWLTPQMDRLFLDGTTARRRFLDRLVYNLDTTHATRINRFDKLMRERLRILKEQDHYDPSWLSALEKKMSEEAIAIAAARMLLIQQLNDARNWATDGFPKAELSLIGSLEDSLLGHSALVVEEQYRTQLATNRGLDKHSGRTTTGPHRSDLKVSYIEKEMPAEHCSTGEQKALLISIILAMARLQAFNLEKMPILLLDEVVAHLDKDRRNKLYEEILNLKMQVWLTGTDPHLFQELGENAQHFNVYKTTTSSAIKKVV